MKDKQILDDHFIGRMLVSKRFRQAFPFLETHARKARSKPSGCGSCGSGRAATSPNYDAIKRTLAALSNPKRKELLELAGAKSAVLLYRDERGRTGRLVFRLEDAS